MLAVSAILLAAVPASRGAILLDRLAPDPGRQIFVTNSGALSPAALVAMPFTLPAGATIDTVRVVAQDLPSPYGHPLDLKIYGSAPDSSRPGQLRPTGPALATFADLSFNRLATGESFRSLPAVHLDIALPTPFAAAPGATYWLHVAESANPLTSSGLRWIPALGGNEGGRRRAGSRTGRSSTAPRTPSTPARPSPSTAPSPPPPPRPSG
jgi:hypothetical protein